MTAGGVEGARSRCGAARAERAPEGGANTKGQRGASSDRSEARRSKGRQLGLAKERTGMGGERSAHDVCCCLGSTWGFLTEAVDAENDELLVAQWKSRLESSLTYFLISFLNLTVVGIQNVLQNML